MWIRFWGTRGSVAKPGPGTVRYGGNTSCVELRSAAGTLVVIDCGTGAHSLGETLMAQAAQPLRGHLLISHTHWDHIQGIPFFAPLFVADNEWDIYAPRGLSQSIQDTLAGQMQYTYFPVSLEALGAKISFHDLVEGVFTVGDITVRSFYLNHPALTLGYRFEADGVSVVYSCDHEPFSHQPAAEQFEVGEQDRRHADFLRDTDLVIHDAQYTAIEYADKIGWGHSTCEYAVDLCNAVGVKQLALTHHDPSRDDDAVDEILRAMRIRLDVSDSSLHVFAAAEGDTIDLGSHPSAATTVRGTAFSALMPVNPAISQYSIFLDTNEPHTHKVVTDAAAAEGVRLMSATNTLGAAQIIERERPSLVIVDEQSLDDEIVAICRKVKSPADGDTHHTELVVITDSHHVPAALAGLDAVWMKRNFSLEYARTRIRAWILRTTSRWERARTPENEEARLAALGRTNLLDSEPEERFDRIVRIAASAFDVPIALVSLVDRDRQWFKSSAGLSAQETPRDMAFCAHAILEDQLMLVPDALLDSRFADNPLVTGEPRVRFYAGCPLKLPDGHLVGTLCIIDTQPRQMSGDKMNMLRELGKLVEQELLNDLK